MQSSGNFEPMKAYFKNPEDINTTALLWRNDKRYFSIGQIVIGFLKLGNDMWLLTTIKKIIKELNVKEGVNYDAYELEQYKKYFGRIIVKYHKEYQTQGIFYKNIYEKLIVNQILPTQFDGYDFPGYDNVILTFSQLETSINQHKKDWVNALKNQKAVYLITDANNGKLYVGSATSDNNMLLSRWENYVKTGHGGNIELKKLLNEKCFDYIKKYFQYSILENYNSKVENQFVLNR